MKFLKIFLIVFVLTISSFSFAGAAFREPTSDLDFVSAPVTSLSPGQIKIGSLNLSWLSVLGDLTTGYVGIGGDANNANSIPQEKLDVQGSVNIHNQILVNNTAPSNGQVLHFGYDAAGSSTMRWGGNYAWVNFTSDVKNNGCVLDNVCDSVNGETCSSCPGDCVTSIFDVCDVSSETITVPSCDLDKMCESAQGETKANCMDCRGCENQGLGCNNNGICEDTLASNQNEGWESCSTDCSCGLKDYGIKPVSGFCGDGIVQAPELCEPPGYLPKQCNPGECVSGCGPNCTPYHYCCPLGGGDDDDGGGGDTVPPNLGGGGDTTPGGDSCVEDYPACAAACPNPGERCIASRSTPTCYCAPTTPSTITDLQVTTVTSNSATLTFSAPLDDILVTSYIGRYSTFLIDSSNFNSATPINNLPTPGTPGSLESVTVSGLSQNTTYYFAIKSSDADGNISLISNVISATTQSSGPDTTPPAAITNLNAPLPYITSSSARLFWNSPGDDGNIGTASTYEVRRSTTPITNGNFSTKTLIPNPPIPLIAGTSQSMTVTGLSPETRYYFAIKTSDEVVPPNTSTISNVVSIITADGSGGGGSTPSLNNQNDKNPFASLLETFKIKLTEKAKAQSGGTCGDTWLPMNCYAPWYERSLTCADNMWIRSCAKEM